MNDDLTTNGPILSVRGLKTWFDTPAGTVRAVDGVSFDVWQDDLLAIVGESGSGKSVTGLSLCKLVMTPPGRYVAGQVVIHGQDVLSADTRTLQAIRGKRIAMLFQHAKGSLDPSFTTEEQMLETLRCHHPELDQSTARARVRELFRSVGFDDIERVAASYPHQLSGGMCQRVALALCMACSPDLLVADEPTTALDVGVQAKILLLLKSLKIPVVIITHDFGVVRAIATRVLVMYAGHVQEQGTVDEVLDDPLHPYTRALIDSVPEPDRSGELAQISGQPPDLIDPPAGCRFAPRCSRVMQHCHQEVPNLHEIRARRVRCHLYESVEEQPR